MTFYKIGLVVCMFLTAACSCSKKNDGGGILTVITDSSASLVPMKESDYRPVYHFTPPSNWMNDPNGLVYYNGTYHLFYQYNPSASVWGPMHWGHATSKDLFSWKDKPVAIAPDASGTIFSGSTVVDVDNTSGFKSGSNDPLVAVYTLAGSQQHQAIAYSVDGGDSWTKYSANPVLPNPGIPDFRDPKVSWNAELRKWLMVLAVGQKVNFYTSTDLKKWTYESSFGEGVGAHGGVWECPDLFELPVAGTTQKKWVLLVSINPGAPNGGSGTQYFVGNFSGGKFTSESTEIHWLDYGTDNYAGVTYNNVPVSDGRRIFIGWMSNWQYAEKVPTNTWRSTNTVPRELSLVNNGAAYILKSVPVKELDNYKAGGPDTSVIGSHKSIEIFNNSTIKTGSYELSFTADFSNSGNMILNVGNSKEKILITVDKGSKLMTIDRSASGNTDFNNSFKNKIVCPFVPKAGDNHFRILIDKTSAEVFVNDGESVITFLYFPTYQYNGLKLSGDGSTAMFKNLSLTAIKKSLR